MVTVPVRARPERGAHRPTHMLWAAAIPPSPMPGTMSGRAPANGRRALGPGYGTGGPVVTRDALAARRDGAVSAVAPSKTARPATVPAALLRLGRLCDRGDQLRAVVAGVVDGR